MTRSLSIALLCVLCGCGRKQSVKPPQGFQLGTNAQGQPFYQWIGDGQTNVIYDYVTNRDWQIEEITNYVTGNKLATNGRQYSVQYFGVTNTNHFYGTNSARAPKTVTFPSFSTHPMQMDTNGLRLDPTNIVVLNVDNPITGLDRKGATVFVWKTLSKILTVNTNLCTLVITNHIE